MSLENDIAERLAAKFSYLKETIKVPRLRRIFLETEAVNLIEVIDFCLNELGFRQLVAITGTDEGERLGLVYHLSNDAGVILNLKTQIPKESPNLKTVTPYFPSADIYEREIMDLFGFKVEGLAMGNRYPLTDDWPRDAFPLRKDYAKEDKIKNA